MPGQQRARWADKGLEGGTWETTDWGCMVDSAETGFCGTASCGPTPMCHRGLLQEESRALEGEIPILQVRPPCPEPSEAVDMWSCLSHGI